MVAQVGVGDLPQRTEPGPGDQRHLRVAAQEDRIRIDPVQDQVEDVGQEPVRHRPGRGPDRGMQVGDADGAGDRLRPQRLHGEAVGQELMVDRGQGIEEQVVARGMDARGHSR